MGVRPSQSLYHALARLSSADGFCGKQPDKLDRLDTMALSYHSWLEMAVVLFFLAFPGMDVRN
jgi:hypothetical protein